MEFLSSSLQRARRASQLAGFMQPLTRITTFLFGLALLLAGVTGCGRATTVVAAGPDVDHPTHEMAYGPAIEPEHYHGTESADHHPTEAEHHHDHEVDDEQAEMQHMLSHLDGPSRHTGPHGEVSAAERRLYLTPGGRYTAADIEANGSLLPSQRFRHVRVEHHIHTQPFDRLCPITRTRANPSFTWVVAGKAYQFCCPPCIDEFVRQAKEHPRSIHPPDFYVKH
jgi:hypothetical protein